MHKRCVCQLALEDEQVMGWTLFYERRPEHDVSTVSSVLSVYEALKTPLCATCAPVMARQRNVFESEELIDTIIAGTATEAQVAKESAAKEARAALVGEGKKECLTCQTILPLSCFQKDKRCLDGYKATCKLCKGARRATA